MDSSELHLLDARKRHRLNKGRELYLEYLLIAGPDQQDWKWIAPALERARTFIERSKNLLDIHQESEKVEQAHRYGS